MRIALGTFGLDIAEIICNRFNEEKKQQRKGFQNRTGTSKDFCIIKKGRGRRLVQGKNHTYMRNDGLSLGDSQRIKLYLVEPKKQRSESLLAVISNV